MWAEICDKYHVLDYMYNESANETVHYKTIDDEDQSPDFFNILTGSSSLNSTCVTKASLCNEYWTLTISKDIEQY